MIPSVIGVYVEDFADFTANSQRNQRVLSNEYAPYGDA